MKYHLARGETQLGTFSDLEVSAGLRDGRFLPPDLCWTEGMKEWQTLEVHMKALAEQAGIEAPEPAQALSALQREVRKDRDSAPEAASLAQRLAASLIDGVMILVPVFLMLSLLLDDSLKAEIKKKPDDPQAVMTALQRRIDEVQATGTSTLMLLGGFMDLAVLVNVVLLTVRGQTLGKLLVGIQIVRQFDGSRAGFVKAVLLRGVVFGFIGMIGAIGPIVLLADVLFIFRRDRRCLHDLVADTRVVRRLKR